MAAAAAIAAALSKINTCQANEACRSTLSMIPQDQGRLLTETMESVKKLLQLVHPFFEMGLSHQNDAYGRFMKVAQPVAAAEGFDIDDQWIATVALRVEELMDNYLEVDCDHLAQLGQVARSMAEIEVDLKLPVHFGQLTAAAVQHEVAQVYVFITAIVDALPAVFFTVLRESLKMAWRAGDTDTDNADLINFLTNRYLTDFFSLDESRKVLCIVGPSRRETGLANATASRLYNDTHKDFNCHAPVELPKGPADPAKILADILKQVSGDHINGQDPIDEVKKALGPKRYIILIKNLRDADTWNAIKGAFPDKNSSRVIITTCRLDVAEDCFSGESDLIYKVRPKPTSGERSGEDHSTSVDTLLSEWPEDLKGCSLYLSTVPDSHVFERASMVSKWMSEGLVPEEKIGHDNFGKLLGRDVIQPKRRYYSKFRAEPTYVVNHRLLSGLREKSHEHNLAIHIDTDSAEEALCRLADPENKKIPRLSLNCRFATSPDPQEPQAAAETFLKTLGRKKKKIPVAAEQRWDHHLAHARSMTVRGVGTKGLVKDLVGVNLCVLDLEGCKDLDNSDVVDICRRLILLKYLSINDTPVTEIPPDIKNLKDLETLDVRETKVAVLPREIDELPGLVHLLVSDWLEMTQSYPSKDEPYSWRNANHLLRTVAVLDIRICQLEKNDLQRLGCMGELRSLALTLAGLPKEEMVITRRHLFKKLRVMAVDCHVPWITFTEGAMPELRRLYLTLYAGPQGKTASGTNHLKKLHEVTLRYSKQYEASVCVKETTRTMQEEGSMRSRPTTFIIDDKVTIPKIQVPNYSKQTCGWLVQKFMRYFFGNIFSMLLPPAAALRPYLARMTNWQLLAIIPPLAVVFYYDVALLMKITPLLLDVARRALHCAALLLLYNLPWVPKWTSIVTLPTLASYHLLYISILAYRVLSPGILIVCTTLFGLVCALLRLVLVCILRPLWYTISMVFSLVAPVVLVFVLSRRLPRMPGVWLLFFLRSLALSVYFFPNLYYSAISSIFLLVCNILKWLIWGA